MKRLYFLIFLMFGSVSISYSCNGIVSYSYFPHQLTENTPSVSRFNIKIQPAIFWATLGVEAEYLVSPKITIALNVLGKLGQTKPKNKIRPLNQGEFLENGFLAELIGRYFIQLSKKKLVLAPSGFYVQASVGYSKLLYFDGNTRPFTLHTRNRNLKEPFFAEPTPIIGGLGAGYQVELLPKKIIANLAVGAQTNIDTKGMFFSIYVSPSIGFMF
jgi:hypothetical protein